MCLSDFFFSQLQVYISQFGPYFSQLRVYILYILKNKLYKQLQEEV